MKRHNGWKKTERQNLFSDNDGKEMAIKYYLWDKGKSHWLISEADYYFFDDNGLLDSIEYQEYVTLNYRMFTRTYFFTKMVCFNLNIQ